MKTATTTKKTIFTVCVFDKMHAASQESYFEMSRLATNEKKNMILFI